MRDNDRELSTERLRKNSTSGSSTKRTKKTKVVMSKKVYHNRMKALFVAGAITAGVVLGAGSNLVSTYQDKLVVGGMVGEFRTNVINKDTHPTKDYAHHWYDYAEIEKKMKENYDNYDEAVYYCERCIGEYQTDKVLYWGKYDSYQDFLESNGYKDTKDFEKHIEKRIVLNNELKDKKEELQAMQDDHAQSQYLVENDTYDLQGGK